MKKEMIIKKIIFALYLLLISSVILISLINFTNLIMQMFLAHHNYQPIKFLKNRKGSESGPAVR